MTIFTLIFVLLFLSIVTYYSDNKDSIVPIEYDVISIEKRTRTTTNVFGGIVKDEVGYWFTYEDGNDLIEYPFYTSRIEIGNRDKYVYDEYNGGHLVLTKETINNL